MADTTTAEVPIWGDELQDWMNIGDSTTPNWVNVTNLLSWEFSDDANTYEPEYIDTKRRPKYTLSKSASIDYEKDMYRNNALDTFLASHEDDTNVPVEVCRVRTWEKATGSSGGLVAKKAAFLLTPNQLDKNTAGEPIKLKGTLSMSDNDWTQGTWNAGKFTAAAA